MEYWHRTNAFGVGMSEKLERNMQAYLDNSATTKCSKRATDLMVKLLTEDFGNPSSMHMKGVEAENYIKRWVEFGEAELNGSRST